MIVSRIAFGGLVGFALAIALAFRLAGPTLRPMHHDEANQAVKFGTLLETGDYRYDRNDHHGPTLYFLTLPAAWLRGQTTLASLDERTLRAVPAVFGVGFILLLPLLAGRLGRPATAAAAFLAALSPVLTFYSRFYIQESLLVFFAMAFVMALGRYADRPSGRMAVVTGVCAGLAFATKETSVIVIAAALVAFVGARWRTGGALVRGGHVAMGVAAGVVVASVFYSSFFRHPGGVAESVLAFSTYVERGVGPGQHTQPWDYYVRLLAWSPSGGVVWTEALVLGLALVGLATAVWGGAGFWPRYIGLYSVLTAVVFSMLRYKTPWNVLPFYAGFVVMAGVGAAALVTRTPWRAWRLGVVVALAAGIAHLAVQDWRANFRYPADPRNPYVYAHTSPDFLRLVARVREVSAAHPDRERMLVKVVAGPYEQWPLPWYLRQMARVGYWTNPSAAVPLDAAPLVIASAPNAEEVGARLGDRYVSEFYGLRPDVLLTVYIERTAWERFLATR